MVTRVKDRHKPERQQNGKFETGLVAWTVFGQEHEISASTNSHVNMDSRSVLDIDNAVP